jgi:membrane fusion protein, multidrug efflux system
MELELNRQNVLVARDASSKQLQEQAQANRDQAVAAVQGAKAAIDSAAANVEVLKGQKQEAISTLNELKTTLAKAERDLSFTVIHAPIDGVVGNRAVQVGDYVQTGQRLASVVPLEDIYVTANFKETQVSRLRLGQTVTIAVDALPEHAIEGVVESFAPASGAVFSLLPPDNATGNFTKIVQRLPVRIQVPREVAREGLLRPGMSVVVSVNTKSGGFAATTKPLQTMSASAH